MGSNEIKDLFPVNAVILFRDIYELEGNPGLVKQHRHDWADICGQEERPSALVQSEQVEENYAGPIGEGNHVFVTTIMVYP
jgi:hypothetical protein